MLYKTNDDHAIFRLQRSCMQSFARLLDLLIETESSGVIESEMQRFSMWAENAGAHRNDSVSLDHRLRKAFEVKDMVLKLLDDLKNELQDTITIASDATQPQDYNTVCSNSPFPSSEEEEFVARPEQTPTELEECVFDIRHVITCLYQFSITIQNPARQDRLEKCSNINVSHFKSVDIDHVSNKFPNAGYLIERCGKANTRRRQLLRYYQSHHNKFANIALPKEEESASNADHSEGAQTTISTFIQQRQEISDTLFETHLSQTSFASSAGDGANTHLRVPPLPTRESAHDDEPFQCPLCFSIVSITGEQAWKRHIFRDLRPYVCTFEECPKSDHLFDSRSEWLEHELVMHRREWYCKLCNLPISSRTAFQDHLEVKHSGLFIPTQLQVIIDRCERPSGANQQCPFCQIEVLQSHVHRHLAQHMQQIALFVINSSGEDIRGSARESDNPSLLKHQDDNPEARIQHAHPQESESMMTQTFSPKGASRFHPKPLQKKKVLIHQQIHQHINGRYITLTVLTEYLKKRWPTTRTEIDNEEGSWKLKVPERISEKEILQLQLESQARSGK